MSDQAEPDFTAVETVVPDPEMLHPPSSGLDTEVSEIVLWLASLTT